MASTRLALISRVVLIVGPVGMLGSASVSLVTSSARVAPVGSARGPVRSLVRSNLLLSLARCLTFGPHNWCWTRDIFGRLVSVELLVDGLWNGCNLGTKLLLDSVEVEAIIPIDQVDGHSQMSETSGSTNAMEISLRILRKIEIDDHVHGLDVDTTSKKIRADKIAAYTVPEIMKDAVTIVLQHLGVRVKAGVSKFGDFLRKQLHSICRVTENDRLIDLKLGKESVEAMDFLFLFDEAVVLRNTSKSELVHQIYFVWIVHMFILGPVSFGRRRWIVTLTLNDLTIVGNVALKSMTWRSLG